MKRLILSTLLIGATMYCTAQNSGLAKVNKRQGIEVYVMSEPVKDYEVTGKVSADDFSSILNSIDGKKDDRTITQMIDVLINNANRKAKKGKLTFDAVMTEDGKTGTLIKFKENKAASDTTHH